MGCIIISRLWGSTPLIWSRNYPNILQYTVRALEHVTFQFDTALARTNAPWPFFSYTPELSSVEIGGPFPFTSVAVPWEQITTLTFESSFMAEMYDIPPIPEVLGCCYLLEHLDINAFTISAYVLYNTSSVNLARLNVLRVGSSVPVLIDHLILPSLEKHSVCTDVEAVTLLIERSHCCLISLSIEGYHDLDYNGMFRLLSHLSELNAFRIAVRNVTCDTLLLLRPLSGEPRSFLLYLNELSISVLENNHDKLFANTSSIVEIARSRCGNLKSLRVHVITVILHSETGTTFHSKWSEFYAKLDEFVEPVLELAVNLELQGLEETEKEDEESSGNSLYSEDSGRNSSLCFIGASDTSY